MFLFCQSYMRTQLHICLDKEDASTHLIDTLYTLKNLYNICFKHNVDTVFISFVYCVSLFNDSINVFGD